MSIFRPFPRGQQQERTCATEKCDEVRTARWRIGVKWKDRCLTGNRQATKVTSGVAINNSRADVGACTACHGNEKDCRAVCFSLDR